MGELSMRGGRLDRLEEDLPIFIPIDTTQAAAVPQRFTATPLADTYSLPYWY